MPGFGSLTDNDYYISVTSDNGSIPYLSWRRLSFSNTDFGFLLLKTDKPIYRPEQDGEWGAVSQKNHLLVLSAAVY